MPTNRLEAFSDGVIAILITIMVLELHAPHDASFGALRQILPTIGSYVLSFVYVGIYWNNHHHLFQAGERVSGSVLWANLHLLFWLSLIPFVTNWMDENHFATAPVATYGVVLLMCGIAYSILVWRMIAADGANSAIARAIGNDHKGLTSLIGYTAAIGLAFVSPLASGAIFIAVALLWLIPDRRIETALANCPPPPSDAQRSVAE